MSDNKEPAEPKVLDEYYTQIVNCIQRSNKLPGQASRDIYNSYPSFHRIVQELGEAALVQTGKVLRSQGFKVTLRRNNDDSNMEKIIDANDTLLHNANVAIDLITGELKPTELSIASSENKINSQLVLKFTEQRMIDNTNDLEKPQLKFKDKIDNSKFLFKPKLEHKPNAKYPLSFVEVQSSGETIGYENPYKLEIEEYRWESLPKQLPESIPKVDDRPFKYINRVEDLDELVSTLETVEVIGVDLEHHSHRSYQGFVCLMQLSTLSADYIVDTLELRSEIHKFNKIFTDPKILKIFHGATSDILWLQRDFGVYVVGMFDTHEAALVLNLKFRKLSDLIRSYCHLTIDKRHQLSDWRIRPLPDDMMHYARLDTVYLIYIYTKMVESLNKKQASSLETVFNNSKNICKHAYMKPLRPQDKNLRYRPRADKARVQEKLLELRDAIARDEDESVHYVMPQDMLSTLVKRHPYAHDNIDSICRPMPPLVNKYKEEFVRTLQQLITPASMHEINMDVSNVNLETPAHDIRNGYSQKNDEPISIFKGPLESIDLDDSDEDTQSSIFCSKITRTRQAKRYDVAAPYFRYTHRINEAAAAPIKEAKQERDTTKPNKVNKNKK